MCAGFPTGHMQYRRYSLHPDVDNYLTHNYKNFKTRPLVQKIYYMDSAVNKAAAPGKLITVSHPINFEDNAINMDVFINLWQIPPMAIWSINVRAADMPQNCEFYKLDWFTIFLYNMRCYPHLVEKNIFVLPNLVLMPQFPNYSCIIDIVFSEECLKKYCFDPYRAFLSKTLPFISNVMQIIHDYLQNFIYIDIWSRNMIKNDATLFRITGMLKASHRNVYLTNRFATINNNVAQVQIFKDALRHKILCTTIIRNLNLGTWEIYPILERIIITTNNTEPKYEISRYDLEVMPQIAKRHLSKSTPLNLQPTYQPKFILTENMTEAGECPGIYTLNFGELINKSLEMNDNDNPNEEFITLQFHTNGGNRANRNKIAYIYIEISSE